MRRNVDISALSQAFRILSTLPDPSGVAAFMGNTREAISDVDVIDELGNRKPYACQMYGKVRDNQVPWSRYRPALAAYLTAMNYNDGDMRRRKIKTVKASEVAALRFAPWNGLKCHSDHGGHRYRCGINSKSDRERDKSWVKVSFVYPRTAQSKFRLLIQLLLLR